MTLPHILRVKSLATIQAGKSIVSDVSLYIKDSYE